MKLNVPKNASSTSRHFSTNSSVLSQIPHPICEKIITWRKLDHSLQSLRSLVALIDKESGRIHTEFDHVSACAGRIYTTSPNLQMIPKRSIIDNLSVRSVFVVPKGNSYFRFLYCFTRSNFDNGRLLTIGTSRFMPAFGRRKINEIIKRKGYG